MDAKTNETVNSDVTKQRTRWEKTALKQENISELKMLFKYHNSSNDCIV